MNFYQIGGIQVCWNEGIVPLVQDEYMSCFAVTERKWNPERETITYESVFYPLEQYEIARCLHKNETYELYDTEKGLLLIYHWATCRFAFGYWMDDLHMGNQVRCYFNPSITKQMPLSAVRFFSCAGLHSKLLQHRASVLHASYIDWGGQAVLFAAPSGTGKSTQAALWEKYGGAEIINGDRVLVRQVGEQWYAFGYPCCGSSKICLNRTLPLRAIVVLRQGKENRLEQISVSQKVRALAAATEVYLWDSREVNQALDLAALLSQTVPVLQLTCRPDEDAVHTLKLFLEENYASGI